MLITWFLEILTITYYFFVRLMDDTLYVYLSAFCVMLHDVFSQLQGASGHAGGYDG